MREAARPPLVAAYGRDPRSAVSTEGSWAFPPMEREKPADRIESMNGRAKTGRPLHVLIAGGGVAGLEALLALKKHAQERVSIELLAAEPQFWYRPLAVAEPFGLGDIHGLDLSDIADEYGALFTLGRLDSVDTERHVVRSSAEMELDYDALLITVGARPVASVPGAFTFRGPADTEAFGSLLGELAESDT